MELSVLCCDIWQLMKELIIGEHFSTTVIIKLGKETLNYEVLLFSNISALLSSTKDTKGQQPQESVHNTPGFNLYCGSG